MELLQIYFARLLQDSRVSYEELRNVFFSRNIFFSVVYGNYFVSRYSTLPEKAAATVTQSTGREGPIDAFGYHLQ